MRRSYLSSAQLGRLTSSLTERDHAIIDSLVRLNVCSGAQLERLHFSGDTPRHRRRVLQALADSRFICRLDRVVGGQRAGSSGFVYALDVAGLRLVGIRNGLPARKPATPGVPVLIHALEVSEVFVRLVEAEREGLVEILDFQAEPTCWRHFPGRSGGNVTLKPDAYVRLGMGGFEDSWYLEHDRGSEGRGALTRKLDAYRAYWSTGIEQARRGVFPRVLWLVPTARRHHDLANACSRQPAESWQLHQVTLYDDAIPTMTEGAA
jgi:hypothetical protein